MPDIDPRSDGAYLRDLERQARRTPELRAYRPARRRRQITLASAAVVAVGGFFLAGLPF